MRRYTVNQLIEKDSADYLEDIPLLIFLLEDRQERLTNVYAPLNTRIEELKGKLKKIENNTL